VIDLIVQAGIFIFGVSAVFIVGRKEHWKRWGYILGLCGQPFWFYMAVTEDKGGIFALCVLYTYSWGQGIWNHWIREETE